MADPLYEALESLSLEIRTIVERWAETIDADPGRDRVRRAVLAERHLSAHNLAALLTHIANAIASGGSWIAGFDVAIAELQLRGDVTSHAPVLLDRVMSRDRLPLATNTPAWFAGLIPRMERSESPTRVYSRAHDGPPPSYFADWWAASGLGRSPIVWATTAGLEAPNVDERLGRARPPIADPQWYEDLRSGDIRDLLGLSHYRKGVCLAVVTYRASGVTSPLRNPTIADAGSGHSSFMTCGLTQNLRPPGKGALEFVHANGDMGDVLEIVAVRCAI